MNNLKWQITTEKDSETPIEFLVRNEAPQSYGKVLITLEKDQYPELILTGKIGGIEVPGLPNLEEFPDKVPDKIKTSLRSSALLASNGSDNLNLRPSPVIVLCIDRRSNPKLSISQIFGALRYGGDRPNVLGTHRSISRYICGVAFHCVVGDSANMQENYAKAAHVSKMIEKNTCRKVNPQYYTSQVALPLAIDPAMVWNPSPKLVPISTKLGQQDGKQICQVTSPLFGKTYSTEDLEKLSSLIRAGFTGLRRRRRF
jgi:hypothetical protein